MGLHEIERQFRRQVLTHALDAHRGNMARAARALGLQRTYMAKLVRDHQIPRPARPAPKLL